jgi:hypothetical protein
MFKSALTHIGAIHRYNRTVVVVNNIRVCVTHGFF